MIKVENKVYYSVNIGKKVDLDFIFDTSLKFSVYRTISEIKKIIKFLDESNFIDYQILKLEVTGNVEKKSVTEEVNEYLAQGVLKVIEIIDKNKI